MSRQHSTGLDTLSPRQQRALPFLIAGRTIEEGCQSARISRALYYEWIGEAPFHAALTAAREKIIEDAIGRLKSAVTRAMDKVIVLMDGAGAEGVQLRAALALLETFFKLREQDQIISRLELLEKALGQRG